MPLLQHKDDAAPAEDAEFPMAAFPSWKWFDDLFRDHEGRHIIKVEEFTDNGTIVVRAELPGVDPDEDVDVRIVDGMLHITAERREEKDAEARDFHHRELRYGSFARTIALPTGVSERNVKATYKDGILDVRVSRPVHPAKAESRRIRVSRA